LSRRILITGATGFVGTHLLKALDRRDHRLFGTSFPHEPEAPDLACENRICRLDIRRGEDLAALTAEVRPNWIFHLAAVSNVRHSWERRGETLETNILGTLHLLEAVRRHAPKARILFVSSSNVYRETTAGRLLTESDALHPLSPYAYSKICGERLCGFYGEVEGVDAVVSRAFPHTGPGQSPDFVCSDWARQIVAIERGLRPPEIQVGNVDVERDFCDVRDVVRAYVRIMERGQSGETYNVSSGTAVSLRRILDLLMSMSPGPAEVTVDPAKIRQTEISSLCGDSRKLREATGWAPVFSLERTLADLLEFWRQSL
jgi:GDP-4-dehydro-6-deoxy-D-mannose reductase